LWQSARDSAASLAPNPSAEALEVAAEALGAARTAANNAQVAHVSAQSRLEAASAAVEDFARLAALAIPLLAEQCPVCSQAIDPAQVEQQLRSRAGETETVLTFQRAVEESRRRPVAAQRTVTNAQDAFAAMEALGRQWSASQAASDRVAQAASSLLAEKGVIAIRADNTWELAQRSREVVDFLQALRRRVLGVLDSLEQDVDRGQLDRAESEIASFTDALAARSQRLEEASQRALVLKVLAEASVVARVEVTEGRFKAVQPLVADIFSRLDPHPAFKTIEFELDTYYRKGTTSPIVRDLVEGVAADPLVIFSTSQANIAALSYFLAMGWSAGDRTLPFVLLDDPVQSMDDVNVLGFADLCRHLRSSRQLIISTHERRFARLLERKLAPRSESYTTRVFDFVGWDRSGPAVQARTVESQLVNDPIRIVRAAS